MSESAPLVSVVMSVRNAAATLPMCLDSIRAQTFVDYELIVMDDGSSDGSARIITTRAVHDRRIKFIECAPPFGLVNALNAGVEHARGEFVARMDADDIMHPQRLEQQSRYLAEHPHIDAVASQVRAFPDADVGQGMTRYLHWQNNCISCDDIAQEVFVEAPITQPSVTLRRQSLRAAGGYRDGDFPEDYELWLRMLARGQRIAKIPRVLLDWRQRANSYSKTDSRYSREAFDRLRAVYLAMDPRIKALSRQNARPFAVWGAGRKTRRRVERLTARGITPTFWIDVAPRKLGRCIQGIKVLPPSSLDVLARPYVLVYVTMHGVREQVTDYLHSLGYRRSRDYLCVG